MKQTNCLICNRRSRLAICTPCKDRYELEQRIKHLEEELASVRSKLSVIAAMGPEENARLRKYDFVFNRPIGVPIPSDEAGRWEMLAFTLHTDVWEAATIARDIISDGDDV